MSKEVAYKRFYDIDRMARFRVVSGGDPERRLNEIAWLIWRDRLDIMNRETIGNFIDELTYYLEEAIEVEKKLYADG
jgi:hypothetical protein